MKTETKNFYIIKSIRMMTHLIREGFDLYKVIDDDKNPHYKVFLFEDTEELRNAMQLYSK